MTPLNALIILISAVFSVLIHELAHLLIAEDYAKEHKYKAKHHPRIIFSWIKKPEIYTEYKPKDKTEVIHVTVYGILGGALPLIVPISYMDTLTSLVIAGSYLLCCRSDFKILRDNW